MFSILLISILSASLGTGAPQIRDPLEMNQEMVDFLDERINHHAPEMARLEMLVSAVFRNDALGFTYAPETKTALQTFTERSGNCLSFTNLFVAMARAIGLDARYREVDIAPTWSKVGRLVVFNRHVNVVVYVEGRPFLADLFPRIDRIEVGGRIVSDARGYAHYYNNVGADWFSRGNPIMARKFFLEAIRQDDSAAFVWANLGVVQVHLGDLDEAEHSYRKALELDEDHLVAMANLVELLKKTGREEEAAQFEDRVHDFKMKNPYYHYSLGERAYSSGEYIQALGHYRDALKRNSKEPHFHHALAKTYTQLGRYEKAMEALKKAAKYAPDEFVRSRFNQKLQALSALLAACDL